MEPQSFVSHTLELCQCIQCSKGCNAPTLWSVVVLELFLWTDRMPVLQRLDNSDTAEECSNLMLHHLGPGECTGSIFSLNLATRECECATDECDDTTETTGYSIYQLSQIDELCRGRHREDVVDEFSVSATLDRIKIEFTDGIYDEHPTYVLSNVEIWEDSAAKGADTWLMKTTAAPPVGGQYGSEMLQPAVPGQSDTSVCVGVCGTASTAACAGGDLNLLGEHSSIGKLVFSFSKPV